MAQSNGFYNLSIHDKCRTLYREGEFLMAIRYYEYKVNLYQLENKLIEVFYNHKQDKVMAISYLDFTSKRMKFYLDQIKLNATVLPNYGK